MQKLAFSRWPFDREADHTVCVGPFPKTQADFARDIAHLAGAFSRIEGDRIALFLDESYSFICALYGALMRYTERAVDKHQKILLFMTLERIIII